MDDYEDDLPSMPPLDDDKKVNLEPEETTAKREKLNPRKRKAIGTGSKILPL